MACVFVVGTVPHVLVGTDLVGMTGPAMTCVMIVLIHRDTPFWLSPSSEVGRNRTYTAIPAGVRVP